MAELEIEEHRMDVQDEVEEVICDADAASYISTPLDNIIKQESQETVEIDPLLSEDLEQVNLDLITIKS